MRRGECLTGLIVDSFAGGGGASTGIEWALGRSPDVAIDHNAEALAMHAANHPATLHLCENVWKIDPAECTKGRDVDLLWASPDCRHHSRAKGGRPVSVSVRGLADVVLVWARVARPRVICLENVVEFADWGPLGQDGRPCPLRRGEEFRRWVRALEHLGYVVEWRELRACDYGAPTIRNRFFLVARCDGQPIVWPAPTHGDPKSEAVKSGARQPWRTAAEIIDWSLPCPSIFLTRDEAKALRLRVVRPLAEKTMARIARGFRRYVLDRPEPFIVTAGVPFVSRGQHGGGNRPADAPLHTVTASDGDQNQVVMPYLAQHNGGVLGRAADAPLSTVATAGSHQQPVMAYLVPRYGESDGQRPRARAIDCPAPSVVPTGNGAGLICAPFMTAYYGTGEGAACDDPMRTATTRDRFALVQLEVAVPPPTDEGMAGARRVAEFLRAQGVWDGPGDVVTVGPYVVVDIGMRMLTPRELARAQGFPDTYILDAPHAGARLTETAQRHKIGNSVSPYPAAALVRANMIDALAMPPAPRRRAHFPPELARVPAIVAQHALEFGNHAARAVAQ